MFIFIKLTQLKSHQFCENNDDASLFFEFAIDCVLTFRTVKCIFYSSCNWKKEKMECIFISKMQKNHLMNIEIDSNIYQIGKVLLFDCRLAVHSIEFQFSPTNFY